jgi:chromate transporter
MTEPSSSPGSHSQASLATIAREWGRIGCIGFGGPPAHINLLRRLCVLERHWISEPDFEDGIAATSLLPGPASTQLAILCAWHLRGFSGALIGGLCFIVPGLVLILCLAALFLESPSDWVRGAGAGAGSAVAAVAVHAAAGLIPASWRRATTSESTQPRWAAIRWVTYALVGVAAGAIAGPYLVLVLLVCGLVEISTRRPPGRPAFRRQAAGLAIPTATTTVTTSGLGALSWVALKVGLLSYGGGFIIIPLMQNDAVNRYHWMSDGQFLNAVALGQITPGPVVHTVAVVGYAAAGLGGGLLAAAVAFTPSFVMVLFGARHFDRLRSNDRIQAFLTGAGPAVIGAIGGSAIPLAQALQHPWQFAVLASAAIWLLLLHRSALSTLVIAGVVGGLVVGL